MPGHEVVIVARQMVQAMDYLHANGITKGAIRPENILIAFLHTWY